jgi:ATP-binding cassette subfamily C protein CydD
MGVLRVAFLSALSLELLATVSVAIVAVEIGVRLLHGGIGFEYALFLLVIAPEYYLPLRTLGMRFHSGTEGAAVAERLYALLDTPLPVEPSGMQEVPQWQTLRFDEVHYAYTPDRTALNGVSLTIERGQHVALTGESGGGKSTLAALILRFLNPGSGALLLDDVPLESIAPAAWRAQIAWVSQKPYLFSGTVEDNIRAGDGSATTEQIIAAAEAANAHSFIMRLPQGYKTPVGERGATLSGGQAQRIAIARAFLKDAPLLILDEPTANLDAENEAQIIEALRRLSYGRTVLSIAHRTHTVRDADAIYMMDGGRISVSGDAPPGNQPVREAIHA